MASSQRVRELLSIAGAIAIGPLALTFGYSQGFMFGVAAVFYFFVCATLVPLLTYAAGRLKFFVWQLAVVSLTLSVIGDNLRLNSIHGREVISVTYGFWVFGTLLSAPLPVYFILEPLSRRRRYIIGSVIIIIAIGLYFGGALIIR